MNIVRILRIFHIPLKQKYVYIISTKMIPVVSFLSDLQYHIIVLVKC